MPNEREERAKSAQAGIPSTTTRHLCRKEERSKRSSESGSFVNLRVHRKACPAVPWEICAEDSAAGLSRREQRAAAVSQL